MPWTLTDITYEISQRKYIVTNPDDYDKYSDMVKKLSLIHIFASCSGQCQLSASTD